ncbi:glycosyltransferase family 4 protein [Sorangium sp. So ce590]|uniref:glycosyltransferase family 4 protein n=1 Tax=unclassified Sorangium TaxID=2621164 RepID=UPI003F5D5E47
MDSGSTRACRSDRAGLVLVGGYPPPYGGVSVHVQRAAHLAQGRFDVDVIDVHASPSLPIAPTSFSVHRCGAGRAPTRLLRAMAHLRRRGRDLVHFHVSALTNFTTAAIPLFASLPPGSSKLITMHGGRMISNYERSGGLAKRLAATVLRQFDHCIAVNHDQVRFLEQLGVAPGRISCLPAFLPPTPVRDATLDARVEPLRRATGDLLLVSGFALRLYGFDVAIEALKLLHRETGAKPGLIVVFYSQYDSTYVAEVERGLAEYGSEHSLVFRDLDPGSFSYLLSLADIFLRPTTTDGDSVALREAGYLGKQVIASDCVARPEGASLFETGSASSLRRAIERALSDRSHGRLSLGSDDNASKLMVIYEQLLGR